LDSSRGVAARRARAVRAGDAFAREPATPRFLPARAGGAAAGRARRGPGGLEPPALGAAHVHPVVRAPRRRGAASGGVGANGGAGGRVRVCIDITAPAHVLVFRPLVEIMRGRGDEVEITARDYAQTLELLELHGLEADAVMGRHAGRSRLQKARQMTNRLGALRKWARGRGFDVALAHGSHELTISARPPRLPSPAPVA